MSIPSSDGRLFRLKRTSSEKALLLASSVASPAKIEVFMSAQPEVTGKSIEGSRRK